MKSLSVVSVLIWTAVAAVVGYFYSAWAITNGFHVPVSGPSLYVSLFLASMILVAVAVPIYRYKRSLKKALEANGGQLVKKPMPVDPFYAVKVLLLAKSAGMTAALFAGWHIGVIIKQLNTTVVVGENITPNIVTCVAALILLAVSFIVIDICKLPNDSNKDGSVPA